MKIDIEKEVKGIKEYGKHLLAHPDEADKFFQEVGVYDKDGNLTKEYGGYQQMKIKAIYRKNLKMSDGKIAAQVAHAVKNLGITPKDCNIIVLKVSDKKFNEMTRDNDCYIQTDKGLTEVEANTQTAAAWIER